MQWARGDELLTLTPTDVRLFSTAKTKTKTLLTSKASRKNFPGFRSDIPNLQSFLKTLPDPEPQISVFSESVKTRKKFALNETNGFWSATLVNLGIIAVRLGRTLNFDPEKLEFIDDEGANRMINQPMRAPWTIIEAPKSLI
jgi:hypothetical protein